MSDLKVLAEQIVGLTLKQANELCEILKNDYGIEPAALSPVVMNQDASAQGNGVEEKQSEFSVVLTDSGTSRLALVKLLKEMNGIGLKEAKELMERIPFTFKEKLSKEEADSVKKKLEEVGAQVEVK